MLYQEIVSVMIHRYSSETRQLQLQSEIECLELSSFMRKHQYTDESISISKLIDHINALSPQLRLSSRADEHKT